MASENGIPSTQKCCKCLQVPTRIIDTGGNSQVYFFVNKDGSFAHIGIEPSGEVGYSFKCVGLNYVPEEGELLFCDDCMQDEFDGMADDEEGNL